MLNPDIRKIIQTPPPAHHVEKPQLNVEGHINILIAKAMSMGRNDYEYPAFMQILKDYKEGKHTPEKAIELADAIMTRKEGYDYN